MNTCFPRNCRCIAPAAVMSVFLFVCCNTFPSDSPESTAIPRPYSAEPGNLLANASFEEGSAFWDQLWTRDPGTGSVKIKSDDVFEGTKALYVRHSGAKDWSLTSSRSIPVVPGEVYELGGMIKCGRMSGRVELSVVTRDSGGAVTDWMYGVSSVSAEGGWRSVSNRFIVPEGCSSVQFRITGFMEADAYVDNVYLKRVKEASGGFESDEEFLSIEKNGTSVTYDTKKNILLLRDSRHDRTYTVEGFVPGGVIRSVAVSADSISAQVISTEENDIEVSFAITASGIIRCGVAGQGILRDRFAAPGNIRGESGLSWVVPQNEGLLVPSDDPYYKPRFLDLAQGHGGLSMPFIGVTDGDEGLMALSLTPDDNVVSYRRPDPGNGKPSGFGFLWRSQTGMWGYERAVEFRFIGGGYVGMAKAYRNIVKERGQLATLSEKRVTVPQLDRLIGAANIWWWGKAEWWSNDPKAAEAAEELRQAGMEKVLWSHEADPDTVRRLNELGYVSGKYDIYQDVWAPDVPVGYGNRKGWPDDLVLLPDGSPMTGWIAKADGKEYPGGVICSSRGYERLKTEVPEELGTHPYLARFIDTATASPLRECYHPGHPLTRSEDREYKSKMFSFLSGELNLITGSETGIDWAVPYLHYFEGMMSFGPYRFDDAGYDLTTYKKPSEDMLRFQVGPFYRIPLFELVYHDCIVSYWYWGDASNRNPELMRDRDLFNLLYGTGPLYILDPKRWQETKDQIIDSYRTATMTSGRCGYEELVDHRFLNEDHSLQYSRFSGGTEVWVNFSDGIKELPDGAEVSPKGYFVSSEPAGPKSALK